MSGFVMVLITFLKEHSVFPKIIFHQYFHEKCGVPQGPVIEPILFLYFSFLYVFHLLTKL